MNHDVNIGMFLIVVSVAVLAVTWWRDRL